MLKNMAFIIKVYHQDMFVVSSLSLDYKFVTD